MANFYVYSGAGGAGTGADWANAYTTVGAALAGSVAAGDSVWVAHDHAESTAGAVTWTDIKGTFADPVRIICVNRAGSVPPVAADLATTATVATTGANSIILANTSARKGYCYGITFNAGSGANAGNINISNSGTTQWEFESCAFNLVGTSGSSFNIGSSTTGFHKFKNCNMSFAAVSHTYVPTAIFEWDGGSLTGATIPTTLNGTSGVGPGRRIFRNFDWSGAGSGKTLWNPGTTGATMIFENCKINASATLVTRASVPLGSLILVRTDSSETAYRTEIDGDYAGDMITSITVARTDGASDGTTPVSWKFTTTANAEYLVPMVGLPLLKFNETVDSNITVTVEGVGDPRHFSALPTDKEFWIDVSYQGTNGASLGVTKSGAPGYMATASALTASTQAWDSVATARANTTAYTAGDVIKLATNPGRIFVCTTSGTTAGSEPAGYAAAVDGGAVTDNTAVFTAAWRFKQVITTTAEPRVAGALHVVPKVAKASSVLWLDPKLAVVLLSYLMSDNGVDFLTDGVNRLIAG